MHTLLTVEDDLIYRYFYKDKQESTYKTIAFLA